ncbi:uncharacterized protein Z519_02055 [Cladophialophora bantiana CBS 173.52]|uniref:Uncharacterized protein n=1 Tax=Cladophialophora bantiana (strain ATCC 10958 / CBS 173.52 / CDC B-1940 / NIH 8579) TaxID=1442370 RepID=A0A0D2IIR2_CLAB1|nr:uncharacterized protein Z519_02055 [Cladophialophora bantiana CBS 173.52]KIW96664.1 hypothetical protein Z519_02055 [Cladophialophora bantiana CBS 173.52]
MSDFFPDAGAGFERLTGYVNYNRWVHDFRTIAEYKMVWELISQGRANNGLEHAGSAKPMFALGLLKYWVDPAIRECLDKFNDAHEAWKYLEQRYKMDDGLVIKLATKSIQKLRLKRSHTVTEYVKQLELLRHRIVSAGGRFSDAEMIEKVAADLTPVDYWVFLSRPDIARILTTARSTNKTPVSNPPDGEALMSDLLREFTWELVIFELEHKGADGKVTVETGKVPEHKAKREETKDAKEDREMMD